MPTLLKVSKERRRGCHASQRGRRARARELIWPSMGGRAFLRWALLSFRRQTGHAHKVALGAALGMLMNFIPLPGLGTLATILLVWLCRGSVLAALLAQIPGNVWVMPFIWWLDYQVGHLLLPLQANPASLALLSAGFSLDAFKQHGHELLTTVLPPLYLGSVVLGTTTALLTYGGVLQEVRRFRRRRHAQRVACRGRRATDRALLPTGDNQ